MRTPLLIVLMSFALLACTSAPSTGPLRAAELPVVADPQPLVLPFAEVEAESGMTTGSFSAFTTSLYDPGAEASGRRFVTLPPGTHLVVTAPIEADSLVIRTSWPDGLKDGVLHVEAAGITLPVATTNRYTWEYGSPDWGTSDVWKQTAGAARHFWDEVHLRTGVIRPGDSVTISNPSSSRGTVLIDLVDFELVPPAIPVPEGAVNFADFGADPTGRTDVTVLLQKALDKSRGKTLYVPEGVYRIETVYVPTVTLVGAGVWRTTFVGPLSQFRFEGKTAALSDFAVFGETSTRDDSTDEVNGFGGAPGPNSSITRVWVEHKKCAFWVGQWNGKNPVVGLTIADCRFRNLMADAVNLCSGTRDSVLRNNHVRNSGDDALAAWSPKNGGPSGGGNRIEDNFIQVPWVASGIALYGGGPFVVRGNVVKDTVTTGSGIYISANFSAWPFTGLVDVRDNLLIRAGAHESDPGGSTGAIRLLAQDLDMGTCIYVFTNNTILDPLESALSFHGPRDLGEVVVEGLVVRTPGAVVDVKRNASGGKVTLTGVHVDGPESGKFPAGMAVFNF